MQRALLSCLMLFCLFTYVSSFGGTINLATLTAAQGLSLQSATMGTNLGSSIASCDFNGDGTKDIIIGAPNALSGAGAVIVIFGGSDFATVDLSDPAASGSGMILSATGQMGFGTKVDCLGNADADTDHTEDLIIGEGTQTLFWAVFGQNILSSNQDISSLTICEIMSNVGDTLIDAVAVGDTTGDGTGDAIITVFDGSEYRGVLIMDFSNSNVDVGTPIQGIRVLITNSGQSSVPMTFAPAGDFNGDSYQDIVVGNLQGDFIMDRAGIIFGTDGVNSPYPTYIDLASLNYALTPQVLYITGDPTYKVGTSVGYAGNVNGDLYDDVIVGAPGDGTYPGAAFIVFGGSSFAGEPDLLGMPGNSEGYIIKHGTSTGLAVGTTVFGSLYTAGADRVVAVCDQSTNCYFNFVGSSTNDLDAMLSEDGFKISNTGAAVSNPMQIVLLDDVNGDGSPDYLIGQGSIPKVFILYGPNKCTSPCKTCSGLTAASWTSCTSCESGLSLDLLYNYNCYGSCPSHSYQDSGTTCGICHTNCLDCTDSTANDCSSCDSGGSLPWFYSNACYGSCPSHTYQASSTTCADCDGSCKSCAASATSCTSCDTTGSLPWFYSSTCYGSCPNHTYQASATTCADCDGNCKSCTGSATTCTSCDTSGSLPWLYNSVCYSSCPSAAPYTYSSTCYTQCPTGMSPDSSNACITTTTTIEVPQAVQTLSSTDETRQVSNEIMSTISSLTLGGVHSIRSQSVQGPVSYYGFLNVDYPDNYGQFAKSNYGSSRMPNPFKNTGKSRSGRVTSVNMYLENQSLLANIGYSIIFLSVCILLIPITDAALAALESHKKNSQGKWYHRVLKRSSISLRWSFLINQFISKYQDLAFFSFLGIYNAGAEDSDDRDVLNLIVCIFGFLITVSGLAGTFLIIRSLTKKLESLSEEEKEKEEYAKNDFLGRRIVLYKDLKKDGFMTMLYPFFLMVRVFGFCFVTIFLCNETWIQLGFLNLYGVLMLVYLLKFRPLEENGQLWMTLAYEIDGFIALLGVTLLAIYNAADGTNENTKTAFGYMIIIANTGMLVLNFISFGLEIFDYAVLVYEKLKMVKEKLKNRKKVRPEPIESISPVSSFIKEEDLGLQSPVIGTPSVIPERHGYFNDLDESPGLPSPSHLSEAKRSPYSSCIEGGLVDDKSSLIKFEHSMDLQKTSPRKRFASTRMSLKFPVEEEIPEAEV